MGVDNGTSRRRLRWLYVVGGALVGSILLVRIVIAINSAGEPGSSRGPVNVLDAFLIALVGVAVMTGGILLFFRRRIMGGLDSLRDRFPQAVVIPTLVDDAQGPALESGALGNKRIRLPGYLVMVSQNSTVGVWIGRRPKLVAQWRVRPATFRDAVASTWAQSEAIGVDLVEDSANLTFVFIPMSGSWRLFPKPLSDDERLKLIDELNRST